MLTDRLTPLLLEALGRAAAEPDGLPLHGGKAAPCLFTATPAGKQAAQRCKDDGLLQTLRTEAKGKTATEFCAITEKGLAFLLAQVNPKQVLEDFIRSLDARQEQMNRLLDAARHMQGSLEALKVAAEKVLQHAARPTSVGPSPSSNGSPSWTFAVIAHLTRWHDSGASEDCALTELYAEARKAAPGLTIGQFHDGLRALQQQQRIYLHPWTGPLYDLPEPALALLVGHEIAYYASIRIES